MHLSISSPWFYFLQSMCFFVPCVRACVCIKLKNLKINQRLLGLSTSLGSITPS